MKNSILKFRPNQLLPNSYKPGIRRPYIDVGEHLPATSNGYFEIARILLSSTTGDVISILSKPIKKGYKIKVEDEYETIFGGYKKTYKLIPTQGEIFEVIKDLQDNELNYLEQLMEYNDFESDDDIINFISIDSDLYPNLNDLLIEYLKHINS
jgi:hypothetical protein